MGLWDALKPHAAAQFLEVIEWVDDRHDTVLWRFPVMGRAITSGSRLVVREGQAAIFVNEGRLSEVFGPGAYDLSTPNTPILSFFSTIAYQLEYPYKGDVLFVSTTQFIDNPWGTPNPILLRDPEFGPVRLRGFGSFAFRVTDPAVFLRQLAGTDGQFDKDEVTGQLKRRLVAALADALGESGIGVLDLASRTLELGDGLRDRINPSFQSAYGVTLTDFAIQNLTLPEEVEKALDTRTKMGVLGNLDQYTKMKAAEAIGVAAANPGIGGVGAGLGVGMGLGQQLGAAVAGAMVPSAPPAVPPPLPSTTLHYAGPSGQAQLEPAAIAQRVAADRAGRHLLWMPGWPAWKAWSEVPEVAHLVPPAPPPLP